MIDALFGSKTRVKLLHLFLNNSGQPFYVREITRKIDEQINSVRRELSNMLEVGIITSDSSDNKLYYQVNQRYEYFIPLKAIFCDTKDDGSSIIASSQASVAKDYVPVIQATSGLRLVVFAGILVKGSSSSVDILLVGNIPAPKAKALIKIVEKSEGRDINYSVLSYDEFYYRLSIRDKFITEILANRYTVIVDKDKVLNNEKGE